MAVTDLDGRILGHRDEPADIATGPEQCLLRVDELFAELTSATRDLPGRLWGIGIGVPGPVEFRSGHPVSPPIMPGWDGYPIRERFVARHEAPVWVDNDVNLLALGEWRSGIAVGHDNVVVVKIGTGIGAGIISNGRITAAPRERREMLVTSRSPKDRSPVAVATLAASRRSPADRHWPGMASWRRSRAAASGFGWRWTSTAG